MTAILIAWGASALVMVALAFALSLTMKPPRAPFGVLVDGRGRYSLTHFQLVVWTIVVLSLVSGIFFGRWIDGVSDPLGFTIPGDVLGLLGISAGSAVTAVAVKAGKDKTDARARVAASGSADPPQLAQIFLLEEGAYADKVVDVTKFQNFVITIVLVVAYVALAIHEIVHERSARAVTALPTLSGSFLVLLGISHGAYLTAKIPGQAGEAPGLNMANRATVEHATPDQRRALGFRARNATA
jgi:hypothetical protein